MVSSFQEERKPRLGKRKNRVHDEDEGVTALKEKVPKPVQSVQEEGEREGVEEEGEREGVEEATAASSGNEKEGSETRKEGEHKATPISRTEIIIYSFHFAESELHS